MKERVVRMRVHEHLYKRFRIICAKMDISMAKQNAELIRQFVNIQEENLKIMGK